MPTLSPIGSLPWELRASGGEVVADSVTGVCGDVRKASSIRIQVAPGDWEWIEVELSSRGRAGPTVRGGHYGLVLHPEASNVVEVTLDGPPKTLPTTTTRKVKR